MDPIIFYLLAGVAYAIVDAFVLSPAFGHRVALDPLGLFALAIVVLLWPLGLVQLLVNAGGAGR